VGVAKPGVAPGGRRRRSRGTPVEHNGRQPRAQEGCRAERLGLGRRCGGGDAAERRARSAATTSARRPPSKATADTRGATRGPHAAATPRTTAWRRRSWWRCWPTTRPPARRQGRGPARPRPAYSSTGTPATTPSAARRPRGGGVRQRRGRANGPSVSRTRHRHCHGDGRRYFAALPPPVPRRLKHKPKAPRVEPHVPDLAIVRVAHNVRARRR